MNALATLFLLVNAIALLALPRRWAPVPLLVGACYMTMGQGIDIGPFRFTVIRLLVLVGALRIMMRGERPVGGVTKVDWLVIGWSAWMMFASLFHDGEGSGPVFASGVVFNVAGMYFLLRIFCQSSDELVGLVKITALLLMPIALEMFYEQAVRRNLFGQLLGGVSETPNVRNGRLRAQGPFRHAILAGTVGAVCVPLMLGIWRQHRAAAGIGLAACFMMVSASASSGPIMTLIFGISAVAAWRWRHLTKYALPGALGMYLALEVVMTRPAYYLISRIDLTGGSTGWHRSRLIESAIKYFDEWWLFGTDYTRHWMATGVSWSPNHTDITNYYIQMGIWGGALLLVLYLCILYRSFRLVGDTIRASRTADGSDVFFIWCLGSALFAHVATGLSVSYFDQSYMFLYLTLAAIGSLAQVHQTHSAEEGVKEFPAASAETPFPHYPPWHSQPPGDPGALLK
jgi:hypothetical protein